MSVLLAGATQGAGRPGYDPADMLKLYPHLYGYFNRVRSSRCLAAEAGRDLGVMWLLGGLRLDVRTIADFRGRSPQAPGNGLRRPHLACVPGRLTQLNAISRPRAD
ncbi:transposase [Sphingomonas sp. CFBP 13733]|jgi:transposase|uniref:transposase n=1 Tax=Sphingomonas sp. CFBP 13733 TaxID=2775291 RepID=UPI001205D452|nr:MAG: transposase [Sphingomonas sp.]